MNSPLRASTALLLLMFIAGCGQSGPLFIPDDPSSIQPPPTASQETDEDDEDDDIGTP
ncbi:MAG: lipoprotein [Gammaproteobacteria bacterium]|nr:lipoprotein [Gammaproteobacteria bacterium]